MNKNENNFYNNKIDQFLKNIEKRNDKVERSIEDLKLKDGNIDLRYDAFFKILRGLVEDSCILIHFLDAKNENQIGIKQSPNYIKANKQKDWRFLGEFYDDLNNTISHWEYDLENSERILIKYTEYIFNLKQNFEKFFKLKILKKIKTLLSINTYNNEYYEKIY